MKKIITYSLLLSIFFLTSCSKDDEIYDETAIIGTWTLSSYFIEGEEMELDDCDTTSTMNFEENYNYAQHTFQYINDNCTKTYSEIGVWKFLGKNVFTTTPQEGSTYKFTVGFSGNTYTTEDLIVTNGVKKLHRFTYTKIN
ncbi:MAG: hypothetical protein COB60_09760 [Flavobacteriaceae bacterium]|nr:MAG: hypothetical protein COB60_09760 [Flavobacteriaceae bacterium]